MKTLFTAILILFTSIVYSQSWCDNGANWKYSFFSVFYSEGYVEISYVGDTLLNGQLANKLNKHYEVYSYLNSQYESYDFGEEYTYENNGVVYIWYQNDWDTLFNINASVGESWTMAKQPINNACDSNSTLTVTAIGNKIINSTSLKYIVVDFGIPFNFSDTIVEKIGFIGSYMLPYDYCNGALDANEGGEFRCYEDDNFPNYKPHYTGNCNFIVGLNDISSEQNIQIVPNPASTKIEVIGFDETSVIYIKDIQGKDWSANRIGNVIHIDELPNGVYVLSFQNDYGAYHQRFIKQ